MVDVQAVGRTDVVSKGGCIVSMSRATIISNTPDCFIELIHSENDPSVWIVRRSKKRLWMKRRISSDWYLSGEEAMACAVSMKSECDRKEAG